MPSKRPKIVILTNEETIAKIDEIANKNSRSRSNMAELIIKEYIDNYEKTNGKIKSKSSDLKIG